MFLVDAADDWEFDSSFPCLFLRAYNLSYIPTLKLEILNHLVKYMLTVHQACLAVIMTHT